MCERFALWSSPDKVASHFQAQLKLPFNPCYNIAPSQKIVAVRQPSDTKREIVSLRWVT